MTEINPAPRESFSKVNPKLQVAWDSVSLGAAKKCWRYYQLTIIDGWRPKKESHHLRYGQLYHRALEVYDHKVFEGEDHETAVRSALWDLRDGCSEWENIEVIASIYDVPGGTVDRYKEREDHKQLAWKETENGEFLIRKNLGWWNPFQYLDEEKAAKETKSVPNLFRTVIWYLDQFGKNDALKTLKLANGKPAVELSFRYELGYTFSTGEPLLHSGHLDRVALLGDSAYFVDRKTSKNTINGNSSWGYFAQFSPNNQMTGYYFAGKVAMNVPLVGGIIDAAQIAKGFSRFERGFLTRTDEQLNEWRQDVIILVKQAEEFAEADYWPMNDTACDHYGGCPMRPICSKDPRVRHIFLATDFKKEPWDPLKVRGDI